MTTTPLPEPVVLHEVCLDRYGMSPYQVRGYTADHLHAHAAAVTESMKQVATLNAEIAMSLKDQLAAKDAELHEVNRNLGAECTANKMLRAVARLALEALEELRYSSTTFKADKLYAEAKAAITAALESKT